MVCDRRGGVFCSELWPDLGVPALGPDSLFIHGSMGSKTEETEMTVPVVVCMGFLVYLAIVAVFFDREIDDDRAL